MMVGEKPGVGVGAAPLEGESFSLLVVDDSEPNRDALSRRLMRRGYRVATAADGALALEMVERERFDLVLLDVMMPGLNGLEVLQRLRQTYAQAELPVIMATAKDESADVIRALELGANDYVTKPLDFPVVLARVQTQLSLRRSVRQILALEERLRLRNEELEAANAQLSQAHDRMRRDLLSAARIQESLLPRERVRVAGWNFAWAFQPCQELAGDALNICPLDENHVGVYVLDVSGHGVAASLLSVTVSRALSPAAGSDSLLRAAGTAGERLTPPAELAERLNQRFPWDEATGQYFTLVYGILDSRSREFHYVSAGHPGGVYVPRNAAPTVLEGAGLPVGLGTNYEQHTVRLQRGDRLYLYSDGVPDVMDPAGELFGKRRLLETLDRGRSADLEESVVRLQDELRRWGQSTPAHDDVSILAIESV